jgi:hypothetical protein
LKATPLLLLAVLAGPASLSAQLVIHPEAKLNPEQMTVRTSLYQLRDTLLLVEAASARIARDLNGASDAALRSRARVMAQRCRAAVLQTDSTAAVVSRGALPEPDPQKVRPTLERALADLRTQLESCVSEFTRLTDPASSEELRGYGIGKGRKVQTAIQNYRPPASRYFRFTFSQQYWPSTSGAGATPSKP